ncbi:RNA 2',3'-cyclic phosphodiesterase [Planococcus beijingensis]|uniref:RNA 2',3'-cyclic phosphodiesterase n=1 Tax=Planococcus beijingensis TaxID=2782551 RepID=UPI00193B4F5F|nr:RNA 2',3'-cyclic phosphodiesterase [Planococcus beijingensis]
MKPHYFIGIKVPQNIAETLGKERDSWQLQTHKRLTPPEDMHITLLFIGEDKQDKIKQVEELLAAIHESPFQLVIEGVQTFGNPKTPRVIYAALQKSAELEKLQHQISESLESLQLGTDQKRYVPHITLANKWAGGEPVDLHLSVSLLEFEVAEFSLFRIAPKEKPRYKKIANYPLGI